MDEAKYGNERKDVGISRLLLEGAYDAAFLLHDVSTINFSKQLVYYLSFSSAGVLVHLSRQHLAFRPAS